MTHREQATRAVDEAAKLTPDSLERAALIDHALIHALLALVDVLEQPVRRIVDTHTTPDGTVTVHVNRPAWSHPTP